MPVAEFTVGMRVTIEQHSGAPQSIRTVTGVSARKVTLSDGSHWSANGRSWGSASETYYMGLTIRPTVETDHAAIIRRSALHRIRNVKWHELSTETLAAVLALVAQAIEARSAETEGLGPKGESAVANGDAPKEIGNV